MNVWKRDFPGHVTISEDAKVVLSDRGPITRARIQRVLRTKETSSILRVHSQAGNGLYVQIRRRGITLARIKLELRSLGSSLFRHASFSSLLSKKRVRDIQNISHARCLSPRNDIHFKIISHKNSIATF